MHVGIMFSKTNSLLLGLVFSFGMYHQTFAGTCKLVGVPEDTSEANLFHILISDNITSGQRAWENPTSGSVYRLAVDPTDHSPYLGASFSVTSSKYWLLANAKTKNFVRDNNVRDMIRYFTLYCQDGTFSKYHCKIRFEDMELPVFGQEEYNLTITQNWDIINRPISDGQFITVSDNAVELENGMLTLKFVSNPPNILRVVAHPLWVLPKPERYHFRLDLYLNEKIPGQNMQIGLSAVDTFNAGATIINITISD